MQSLDKEPWRQQTCTAGKGKYLRFNSPSTLAECGAEGCGCSISLILGNRRRPAAPLQSRPVASPKLSPTCVRCRDSHLKCTGGATCARCAWSGKLCSYVSSRRGRRKKRPDTNKNLGLAVAASPSGMQLSLKASDTSHGEQDWNPGSARHLGTFLTRCPPNIQAPEERRALSFYCDIMMPSLIAANPATSHFWTAYPSM
jgi:hypothetical protein